jgi:hypothetical protein
VGKTNSLTSHHPERHSHRADKGIPKEEMKRIRECGSGKRHTSELGKVIKKMHKKKRRQYIKKDIKKRLGDGE